MPHIQVLDLGRLDYATALQLQQTLAELRKAGSIADTLLLVEHTPVITLGRNAQQRNILASAEQLTERGIEVFETNRGGDVTFHGPGQLVGYPIVDLRALPQTAEGKRIGAIEFVRRIEETLIRALADFGIAGQRVAGSTGVWTVPSASGPHSGGTEKKLAAIGIHISRGVTSHGFALNVTSDLDHFKLIVPCGIADKPVTSMALEAPAHFAAKLNLENVAQAVTRQFGNVFGVQVLWLESLDQLLPKDERRPAEPQMDDRNREPEELKKMREELERAPREDVHWA